MRFPGRALLIAVIIGLLVVAAADVADPASQALQRRRFVLWRADRKPILASGWRIPALPALRDLPVAQLHCRPAARDHGNRRASTAPAISRSSSRSCCRFISGAGLVCHLPVPVGMERSAGGRWFSWVRKQPDRADGQAQCLAWFTRGDWEISTTSPSWTIIVPSDRVFSLQRYSPRAACRLGERRLRQCNPL